MKRIFILDDNKKRHESFVKCAIGFSYEQAYNAQEAISKLDKSEFDLILLDHDLDESLQNQIIEGIEDGRFVARWLAGQDKHRDTPVIIHSLNYEAAKEMVQILKDAKFNTVQAIPFAWQMIEKSEDGRIIVNTSKNKPHYSQW